MTIKQDLADLAKSYPVKYFVYGVDYDTWDVLDTSSVGSGSSICTCYSLKDARKVARALNLMEGYNPGPEK
jgi:hypothetical protein